MLRLQIIHKKTKTDEFIESLEIRFNSQKEIIIDVEKDFYNGLGVRRATINLNTGELRELRNCINEFLKEI